MNKYNFILAMLVFFTIRISAQSDTSESKPTLFQISIIDSLYEGKYDGKYKLSNLLEIGDFGLGTFDKLNGEMIILNSSIYQFKDDGLVYQSNADDTTPFACIVKFNSNESYEIFNMKDDELKKLIDSLITNKNLFYALKLQGEFSYIRTRTIALQKKPYKQLNEVLKNQIVFERTNLSGTLIGFYCPSFVDKINVSGYHFHFINDELNFGGHVLNFRIDNGKLEIQKINQLKIILPD